MKLFISHAFEDKDTFVRPLAERLRNFFEVWYDEYELTLGDSLFEKINQGLTECDYGVVILSPSFFNKDWPQRELNGLFALETRARKIILPVWKDIDKAGVAAFSPILADRLAVEERKGIEAVVDAIKQAIDSGQRSRDLTQLDGLAARFQKLDHSLRTKKVASQLRQSVEGVEAVKEAFRDLQSGLTVKIQTLSRDMPDLACKFENPRDDTFEVKGPFLTRLNLQMLGLAINSTSDAYLEAIFYRIGRLRSFGERDEPEILERQSYFPDFQLNERVVWKETPKAEDFFTMDQLQSWLLEHLVEHFEDGASRRS